MGDPKLRNTGGTEIALDLILALRFDLDLYANVRPVRLLPGVSSPLIGYKSRDSINYTIIRENSEGLYSSHFLGHPPFLRQDQMQILLFFQYLFLL